MESNDKTSDVVEIDSDNNSLLIVDPHNQDALAKNEQSNLSDRMKRALGRIASGFTCLTKAASASGAGPDLAGLLA